MSEPQFPLSLRTRRRCFRGLVEICGEYGILPGPYTIPKSKIKRLGDFPVSSSGFSDVWPGSYKEGKDVAIKVLRYCQSDDIQPVKKVSCFDLLLPFFDRARPFADVFPRGHHLEASVTPEHTEINRSHNGRERVFHGVTVDGEWEYRRVPEGKSPG